jgi:AbrB family looped-hinge helix DNA binding protein
MQTKITADGRVTIPKIIIEKLGLRPGDILKVTVEGGAIILTPQKTASRKAKYRR